MKPRFLVAAGILLVFFFVASSRRWLFPAVAIPAILVIHTRASRSLRRRVERRSHGLRAVTFDVLAATEGEEAIRSDYTTDGAIHVLVNRTGPNTLRVLVRGSVDVLFYTLVRFDGFHAGRDGQLRAMDRAEYDAVEWGESPEELAVGPRDSRAIE